MRGWLPTGNLSPENMWVSEWASERTRDVGKWVNPFSMNKNICGSTVTLCARLQTHLYFTDELALIQVLLIKANANLRVYRNGGRAASVCRCNINFWPRWKLTLFRCFRFRFLFLFVTVWYIWPSHPSRIFHKCNLPKAHTPTYIDI